MSNSYNKMIDQILDTLPTIRNLEKKKKVGAIVSKELENAVSYLQHPNPDLLNFKISVEMAASAGSILNINVPKELVFSTRAFIKNQNKVNEKLQCSEMFN